MLAESVGTPTVFSPPSVSALRTMVARYLSGSRAVMPERVSELLFALLLLFRFVLVLTSVFVFVLVLVAVPQPARNDAKAKAAIAMNRLVGLKLELSMTISSAEEAPRRLLYEGADC